MSSTLGNIGSFGLGKEQRLKSCEKDDSVDGLRAFSHIISGHSFCYFSEIYHVISF